MLQAAWRKYTLDFTFEARTSRGSMWHKPTFFIEIWDTENPEIRGMGECNIFPGLSQEDGCDYEGALDETCHALEQFKAPETKGESLKIISSIPQLSSIIFGVETAIGDLRNGGRGLVYPSAWTEGRYLIPINGLIWMGDKRKMMSRIEEKLSEGFRCLKLKIGGIHFDDEVDLLRHIRKRFSQQDLAIRLDANGAFMPAEALEKLGALSKFCIHSIEQPIKAGQWEEMANLCAKAPIPIALDEELIGMTDNHLKEEMLTRIKPQYIILKPALCGGFAQADQWIATAIRKGINWWATSALESNIGLSAIAQWTAYKLEVQKPSDFIPQGLGTGHLYSNNLPSNVHLQGCGIVFDGSRP